MNTWKTLCMVFLSTNAVSIVITFEIITPKMNIIQLLDASKYYNELLHIHCASIIINYHKCIYKDFQQVVYEI